MKKRAHHNVQDTQVPSIQAHMQTSNVQHKINMIHIQIPHTILNSSHLHAWTGRTCSGNWGQLLIRTWQCGRTVGESDRTACRGFHSDAFLTHQASAHIHKHATHVLTQANTYVHRKTASKIDADASHKCTTYIHNTTPQRSETQIPLGNKYNTEKSIWVG